MIILTNNGEKIEIPFSSPICEHITTKLSDVAINEIKDIANGRILSEQIINFIYVMKLDYLLYNFKVKYVTDNPHLLEIQIIKDEPVLEMKLHKLLKRFRGYEEYLNIDFCNKIDIMFSVKLGYINILDYLYRRNIFTNISPLVDQACKYGHINMVSWFYYNTRFSDTRSAIDNAYKYGHLDIVEWFKKLI